MARRVVQRRAPPPIPRAVVGARLVDKVLDNLEAALGSSEVHRRALVIVADIDIEDNMNSFIPDSGTKLQYQNSVPKPGTTVVRE